MQFILLLIIYNIIGYLVAREISKAYAEKDEPITYGDFYIAAAVWPIALITLIMDKYINKA